MFDIKLKKENLVVANFLTTVMERGNYGTK